MRRVLVYFESALMRKNIFVSARLAQTVEPKSRIAKFKLETTDPKVVPTQPEVSTKNLT